VRHVAAESIDAHRLPMFDHLVHLLPGVRNWFVRAPGIRVLADRFRGIGKIETIIEFYGLVPVAQLWRPGHDVVARHAAERFLALEKSIAFL
jgi:hypothetical protein